jgi:ring-1,2-phenylacetyl-CoA epoxidase subunit PaaE
MVTFTLKVVEIVTETNDTVTICFKQPALKKVKYVSGQYLTLIFRINGRRYIRPYSFSSAPEVDQYLEITVKRVPGGIVSNHICDKIAIGDVIEVMPPLGDFIFDEAAYSFTPHLVLWGAGSGITPLISIAKSALKKNPDTKITLVYGNRNFESIIFSDQINKLTVEYKGRFKVWHFHTKLTVNEDNPYLVEGRIDPKKVLSVMHHAGELINTLHFICGPTGLKDSAKSALGSLGIADEHIFSEDFELIKDPKDFEDVVTRVIEIDFKGETQTVEVVKGKSILEAGLDALVELPYSCQTGNCSVCKGKVISGKVKTISAKQSSEELAEDEYLLCCSYPLTDEVKLLVQ